MIQAAEALQESGIEAAVLRLLAVEPLPVEQILAHLSGNHHVVIVEETCSGSGIREAAAWELQHALPDWRVDGIDLGHRFVTHGDICSLYHACGLDAGGIADYVREVLKD